jgi:TrmH family RNA methyltransferase
MLAKEILSLQHPLVKHLVRVRQNKSYREAQETVLFTGINALKELAQSHSFEKLFIQKGFNLPFSHSAKETYIVSKEVLSKITALENPEGVAAELRKPEPQDLSKCQRVLLIDKLSDPGNLGTLLRTALSFGWGVFIMEGSVDLFNDKTLRASKGAIFSLVFDRGDEEHLKKLLSKRPWKLLAADPEGKKLPVVKQEPLILAIGNEAHGLSSFIKKTFETIAIPMKNHTESLNAAIAGGILLYLFQETPQ